MLMKKIEADLYCIHCCEEVPHEVTYIRDQISHIECLECGKTLEFNHDIFKEYKKHVYKSFIDKPKQFTEESRKDLSKFLFDLPVRIITKPYRFAKEVREDVQDVYEYKKRKDKDKNKDQHD
ncbi:bh protein [Alkalicoccus saliphilus]|uniref:Bh protein n=1 Tax=Alkalicoccus saliphilus TaxID=200989 RepID=A0A2T4U297_9BACI|nr:bh protein [Alkalicoccus saliphilus]PTL37518.1 bh protein [Alkalicoccus saliphilus]